MVKCGFKKLFLFAFDLFLLLFELKLKLGGFDAFAVTRLRALLFSIA